MRRKEHSQRHLLWEFRVQSRERTKLNAASRLAMRGEREEDRESVGKVDQERQTTERTSHKRRAWRGWEAGEGSLWTSWFLLAHLGQGQESLDCSLLLPFFFFLFSFFFSFFFFFFFFFFFLCVALAILELTLYRLVSNSEINPPASASRVLGLKACATTARPLPFLRFSF